MSFNWKISFFVLTLSISIITILPASAQQQNNSKFTMTYNYNGVAIGSDGAYIDGIDFNGKIIVLEPNKPVLIKLLKNGVEYRTDQILADELVSGTFVYHTVFSGRFPNDQYEIQFIYDGQTIAGTFPSLNGTSQILEVPPPPLSFSAHVNTDPPILTAGTSETKYLQIRFYFPKHNQTIPHDSFFLNVTRDDQKLMYDLFHTHSGIIKLKFESGGSIGNWTVKGDKEPALGGWMNNTGPIEIRSPIFVENGSYHIHIEMVGAFSDNNLFSPTTSPKFDSYVTVENSSESITQTVPEFGSLTGMIIAISIIGVVLISRKFNHRVL